MNTNQTQQNNQNYPKIIFKKQTLYTCPQTVLIKNRQHDLLPEQQKLAMQKFHDFQIFNIPPEGLTKEDIINLASVIKRLNLQVLILSPIPFLLKLFKEFDIPFYVFHNDKRIKKEITDKEGNKKIITTIAPEGWEIL